MRKLLLATALATCCAIPAHAETSAPTVVCIPYVEGDTVTVSGHVALTRQVEEAEGEPPHNYYEIVLEVPLCSRDGDLTLTALPTSLKRDMLGHFVTITGTMEAGESVYLNEKSVSEPNPPSPPSEPVALDRSMSCREITDNGWYDMPDTRDYVLSKPHADKLGFPSSCHLDSLVFSQCWLEPKITIGAAIDTLLKKAAKGQNCQTCQRAEHDHEPARTLSVITLLSAAPARAIKVDQCSAGDALARLWCEKSLAEEHGKGTRG